MRVYELLRPGRAKDKAPLLEAAARLRAEFGAERMARFVEEAAAVYERRGLFTLPILIGGTASHRPSRTATAKEDAVPPSIEQSTAKRQLAGAKRIPWLGNEIGALKD